MASITLHPGESYSLTTGKVTSAVTSKGVEDPSSPVERALRQNDPSALLSLFRTL